MKSLNCGVSCTGLYADLAFSEDTFLKTEKIPFSATVFGNTKVTIKREEAEQGKEREKLLQLLGKYTTYKKEFVKQLKFDPKSANLSKFIRLFCQVLQ